MRRTAHDSRQQPLSIPSGGEIEICPLRQAQSIAEQRGWDPPLGTYHELERAVNTGCQVARRPQSGDVTLKEVGELYELRVRGVRDNCMTVFGAYVKTTGMFCPGDISYAPLVTQPTITRIYILKNKKGSRSF